MQRLRAFLAVALSHPAFLPSLAFHRGARFVFRRIYGLYFTLPKQRVPRWRVLGAAVFQNPLALPVIMTTGPRWNTHAIIARGGTLTVAEALQMNIATANAAARAWTIVVYSFPDYRTITQLDALHGPFAQEWQTIPLAPGRYTLVLRYYQWGEQVRLPEVRVDGQACLTQLEVPADHNAFLDSLHERSSWFYRWLHGYIYPMLLHQDTLPADFVYTEFLPVGNPETHFYYGAIRRGEALHCTFDARIWQNYTIYLTVYNRCSFPLFWHQVPAAQHQTQATASDGFYLLRCHPTRRDVPALHDDQTTIRTVAAGASGSAAATRQPGQ